MLENEPDTKNNPPSTDDRAPAPTRRRRAASRPAGPPTSVPDTTAIERVEFRQPEAPVAPVGQAAVAAPSTPQAEIPAPAEAGQPQVAASELPATKAAKKTPAKRAAKKAPAATKTAAAAAAPEPGEALADVEPPRARTPRKRAAKKVAEVPPVTTDAPNPAETMTTGTNLETLPPVLDAAIGSHPIPEAWVPAVPEQATTPLGAEQFPRVEEPSIVNASGADEAAANAPADERDLIVDAPEGIAAVGSATETDTPLGSGLSTESDSAEPLSAPEEYSETRSARSPMSDPFAIPDPFAVLAERSGSGVESEDLDVEDDADDDSAGDDLESSPDDEAGEGNRRRRRRRGGRRRRRGGSDEDLTEPEDDAEPVVEDGDTSPESGSTVAGVPESTRTGRSEQGDAALVDQSDEDVSSDPDLEDSEGQRRRRRRRRRRGEESGSAPGDPTEVVVRVREPRARKKPSQEVTGIDGSTRMEAKRQRRREGREAGRRRAPILSEAEFLARRESVSRKMIIRQREDLSQIAVIEDGILVEHYVDRDSATSLIGNVYLGRVQNVLPSMEAAFIDIGRGRNAVLYAGEVDWDSLGAEGQGRKVEKVLKSGQTILVQVSKDPVGAKGARLTNHVSIPGRYIVYAPGGHLSGISRKLPDIERKRLKDILADLVGESASVIVRTAAEGASEEELVRDVNRLKAQWEDIERKVKAGNAPQLLYGEPDLTVRIVRDLFTEDFSDLIIQGNGSMNDAYDAVEGYVTHVAPHLQDRLHRWDAESSGDLFAEHRLDEQIAKGLERKVFLPSGGSLVIDRSEAMTVIDVNTGKFTGTGGNLEATVTSNNLEAAEEIVRQLRLRDIGGIIVVDFIDMVLPNNRELLLRRLVECLGRDRTRHQVAEVTSLGLVQMTRKKIGTGLLEAFSSECEHCHGRGYEVHGLPVDTQKQADGGAREPRPGDHRRGGNHSSSGGSQTSGGPNSDNRSAERSSQRSGDERPEAAEPVAPQPEAKSGEDERPARRSRGGRGRRGAATREQGAPSDTRAEPVLTS